VAEAGGEGKIAGSSAAALLLMLFSEDEAAEILSRLEPDEVRQLGYAMYDVADVEVSEVNMALDHFVRKAKGRTTIGYGASKHIRGAMVKALGPERADNMLARITPPTRSSKLAMLKWMDSKEIYAVIENEHPQIMAIVLAHLDGPGAGAVLQYLTPELQEDVIYRIATLGPVSAEALDELEELFNARDMQSRSGGATTQRGGATEAAAIMNNIRKDYEQRISKALAKRDRQVAQQIEDEMFVFENLLDLDDKNLGGLMRTIDAQILVVALKGASEVLRTRILSAMSQRAAQSIVDEMEERGPMRLAEVMEAQRAIIAEARKMADQGTIMLAGKGDDYV
jgi:flagellar motor switch protein FliG